MSEVLEVIVGIYEGYVCGYKLIVDRTVRYYWFHCNFSFLQNSSSFQSKIPTVQISKTFAGSLHTQSVRTLATGGHYLASGGADDRVRVYDLKKRQEIRELLHHVGTVNSLVFVDNAKYLITGGSDGKIAFINTKKWQLDKVWEKAHKGGVTCISVHPEESLALTVGTDLQLKSWNLVNGRNIYTTNLKNKSQYGGIVEHVRWSPSGDHFALSGARIIEVFSLDTGNVIKTHTLENRVTDFCWIGEADILVGQDSGEMFFFNIENDESNTIPAHDSRLKAMYYVEGVLATISSAGDLSIWYISEDYTEIIQLREYNLDCRPTSLCIVETSKLGLTIDNELDMEEYAKPKVNSDDESLLKKEDFVEEERVTVEYENDLETLTKSSKGKKKRKIEPLPEPELNNDVSEEFKGQKKRKIIEERAKAIEKSPNLNKKQRKRNKRASAMEFDVTDDVEEAENDTNIQNGSKEPSEVSTVNKKAAIKGKPAHKPKGHSKKKRQGV